VVDVLEVDGSLLLESPPEPSISDNPEKPSLTLLFTGHTVFIIFLKYEFVILFLLLLIYYNILY
jgi:hypothetical protein